LHLLHVAVPVNVIILHIIFSSYGKKEKGSGKKKKNSCQEKDIRCCKKNSPKEQEE